MKILTLIILFTSSFLGFAEEDFPVLSLQRKKWEEARITAQAKVDKSYLLRLQELKKASVKKGDLDAARAFEKAIKGEAKGDEDEPATLTKMRMARVKALEAAYKPIDKDYWEELKSLKGYSQRQGDLDKMEAVIAEINKLLAPYANQNKVSQKDKPIIDNVEEISLTTLKPISTSVGDGTFASRNRDNPAPESVDKIKVGDLICEEYLFAHAHSEIRYRIPDFARFFSGVGTGKGGGSYKFVVKVDGEVLFESEQRHDYKDALVPMIVEIPEGAKIIELVVNGFESINGDNSVWANPMFRAKKPTPGMVLSLK